MSEKIQEQQFVQAALAWVCEGYSFDIRFLAGETENGGEIWDASIQLNPLPPKADLGFQIAATGLKAGQIQGFVKNKEEVLELLQLAITGAIKLPELTLVFPNDSSLSISSEMNQRDRWFSDLHLQVSGNPRPSPGDADLVRIDNRLRLAQPPFDGLNDIATWLALRAPGSPGYVPTLTLRVGPPVDIIFDECTLAGDHLKLVLHAHPKFDVHQLRLAVRAIPGGALKGRMHVADQIEWTDTGSGRLEGRADVSLEHADNVLIMLMIESIPVRRQWIIDKTRARNNRFLAVQHFDQDLKMVRRAILDWVDADKFEQGVASLLFLLGFSPIVQVETNAPDLIVTTPGGRLAIVECTTKIADFSTKLGKLVDRRGALSKYLSDSEHPSQVHAVLVCRMPRGQIAANADELRSHGVILITGEDLLVGLDRSRFPNDPDGLLDAAMKRAQSAQA